MANNHWLMNKTTYTCLIACLFAISISCNKEATLTSSQSLPTSSEKVSQPAVKYFIGEQFGGGIIFYLDKSGKHGLISSSADLEEPAPWSRKDTLNGAKDTALGAGAVNTVKIFNTQGYPQFDADNYAALECIMLTQNGYEDWYLPSVDELIKLYQNKTAVGGFQLFSYWSSSEVSSTKAWLVNFSSGTQSLQFKTAQYALRPIRKF